MSTASPPSPHLASQTPPLPVAPMPQGQVSQINFEEAVDDYLTAFKAKLLQKLHDLDPDKFEGDLLNY